MKFDTMYLANWIGDLNFPHRFEIYYYACSEFGKKEKPVETILTVDSTKKQEEEDMGFDKIEIKTPPLESAIHTK